MKTFRIYTILLSVLILISCTSEKKEEENVETKQIVVKAIPLKKEIVKDVKSYFGTLKFSKSTDFVAQQPGVITKLNAIPGQKVNQGEVIVMYPPMNHQLQIEQAKIQQNKTQQDYARQKELYEAGAVTKASLEDYKTQLNIEQKTIQQLQRVNIITAPFTGIITQTHANVGQEMSIDAPIFSMAQLGNIEIVFYVNPQSISEIQINSPVFFIKEGKKIHGKVTKKSIQLDDRRKAFKVSATFINENILFVGNTVDVIVETGKTTESIWIPIDTYRKLSNKHYVYVIQNNKAIKKEIHIGKRNEQFVQVVKGLQENELLITAGIDKIENETAVITNTKN